MLSHWTAAELSKLTTRAQHPDPRDRSGTSDIFTPIPGVRASTGPVAPTQARHPALTPPRTRIEETTLDLAEVSKDVEDALAWLARACGSRLTTPDRLRTALDCADPGALA